MFDGIWHITNKGKAHGEEMPYELNGHRRGRTCRACPHRPQIPFSR